MAINEKDNLTEVTDAKVWARLFMDRFGNSKYEIDERQMVEWFAGAIQAGHKVGWREAKGRPRMAEDLCSLGE